MSFAIFLFFLLAFLNAMGVEIIADKQPKKKKSQSSLMELQQKNKSNETFINK